VHRSFMSEIWLRPNRRILGIGLVFPALATLVGVALICQKVAWPWPIVLVICGAAMDGLVLWQMFLPRLARGADDLLVYLRTGRPLRLPIEYAECFFLAKAAGQLTTARGDLPIRNLVMRVAERAADYQNSADKAVFGNWSEGYINFYGTWCEPL